MSGHFGVASTFTVVGENLNFVASGQSTHRYSANMGFEHVPADNIGTYVTTKPHTQDNAVIAINGVGSTISASIGTVANVHTDADLEPRGLCFEKVTTEVNV